MRKRPEIHTSTKYQDAYDVLLRSAREYGDLPAVGARNLMREHEEVKIVKKVMGGKEKEV